MYSINGKNAEKIDVVISSKLDRHESDLEEESSPVLK